MRVAALRNGSMRILQVPDPAPGHSQVPARVRASSVCGSDPHVARHGAHMMALSQQMTHSHNDGPVVDVDLGRDVYLGHEFAHEYLGAGPGTPLPVAEGSLVTSRPTLLGADYVRPIGYSTVYGGYGEYLLLSAALSCPLPNGLPAHHADPTASPIRDSRTNEMNLTLDIRPGTGTFTRVMTYSCAANQPYGTHPAPARLAGQGQ